MSQSENAVEFSKKKKRNEKEGKDQVLSFLELKSYFDKKFEDIDEKVSFFKKKLAVSSFNYKDNGIQHEFNLNLIEDMEVLIHLIQKRFNKLCY